MLDLDVKITRKIFKDAIMQRSIKNSYLLMAPSMKFFNLFKKQHQSGKHRVRQVSRTVLEAILVVNNSLSK